MFTFGSIVGFILGAILGGLVMIFIVRANPQLIISANSIARAYKSVKEVVENKTKK